MHSDLQPCAISPASRMHLAVYDFHKDNKLIIGLYSMLKSFLMLSEILVIKIKQSLKISQ